MLNKLKGWLVELPIGSKKGGRILMLNSAEEVGVSLTHRRSLLQGNKPYLIYIDINKVNKQK